MSELKDRYKNNTANNFFQQFVKRAHAHHEKVKESSNQVKPTF
jgi:hypothetical protein